MRNPDGELLVLMIDASHSMREKDFRPSRIDAARRAVRRLVDDVMEPGRPVMVSLVLFYARPVTILYPTTSLRDVREAIDSIRILGAHTAIGDALLEAARIVYTSQPPPGYVKRVIVLTDGLFDRGVSPRIASGTLKRLGVSVDFLTLGKLTPVDVRVIRHVTEETRGTWIHSSNEEELLVSASKLAARYKEE